LKIKTRTKQWARQLEIQGRCRANTTGKRRAKGSEQVDGKEAAKTTGKEPNRREAAATFLGAFRPAVAWLNGLNQAVLMRLVATGRAHSLRWPAPNQKVIE